MGAWGIGAFEDDMALDWLADYADEGADAVEGVLETVDELEAGAYLEADLGAMARAAAEIMAAAHGHPAADMIPEADEHLSDVMAIDNGPALALRALSRIAGTNSELAELFAESHASEWDAAIDGLKARLELAEAGEAE